PYVFDRLRKRADGKKHHATATAKNDANFPELARTESEYRSGIDDYRRSIVHLSARRFGREGRTSHAVDGVHNIDFRKCVPESGKPFVCLQRNREFKKQE